MSQGKREEKRKDPLRTVIKIFAVIIALMVAFIVYMITVAPRQLPARFTDDLLQTGSDGDKNVQKKKLKDQFYTFLLVGTNDDYNADTIMLGSIDVKTLKCNMISIPRDSYVDTSGRIKRINGTYGKDGIEGLCKAVYGVTGVYPQYYAVLNMKAFIKVVDIIGGVDFYVPMRMYHPDKQSEYTIDLQKGQQKLDGKHALQMVRFRGMKGSDFGRQSLQKDFLVATLKQVREKFSLSKAGDIIETIAKSIKTNMSVKDMVWFYTNVVSKMDLENDIVFHTIPYKGTGIYNSQDYVFLDAEGIAELVNETVNPYTTDISPDELNVIDPR